MNLQTDICIHGESRLTLPEILPNCTKMTIFCGVQTAGRCLPDGGEAQKKVLLRRSAEQDFLPRKLTSLPEKRRKTLSVLFGSKNPRSVLTMPNNQETSFSFPCFAWERVMIFLLIFLAGIVSQAAGSGSAGSPENMEDILNQLTSADEAERVCDAMETVFITAGAQ